MKASRVLAGAILAGGLWTGAALAQAPPAAAAAAGVDPAAAAAAKPTFCDRLDKAIDKCRRKLCKVPLGGMLNSITKPLSAATGGIIPGFCPLKPSEEDQKKGGAEGAAAQAMKDAVEAQARRKAVRILGTFDCHWYPEAEAGLAAALRTDRAECVRLEAAIALNRGCCCTRLIVEALEDCVNGTDLLGPSENSPRVQTVAQMALERCLTCPEAVTIQSTAPIDGQDRDKEKERGGRPGAEGLSQPQLLNDPGSAKPLVPAPPVVPPGGPTTMKGSGKPSRALLERAARTLAMAQARGARSNPALEQPIPAGQHSLAGLADYVVHGEGPKSANTQTAMPPVAAVARVSAPATKAAPSRNDGAVQAALRTKSTAASTSTSATTAPAPTPPARFSTTTTTSTYRATTPNGKLLQPRTIDPTVLRCLETLRDAEDPEARHTAVRTLVACNWHEHPEAISGLMYAARHDKHPGMRVACIRSLAAMKAATPEVMTGLRPMTVDADPWIRQETIQALNYLQPQQQR